VEFRISLHSGFAAPANALELLSEQLGASRDGARFATTGTEIRASLTEDGPVSMERDEREDIGRRAVLEIVREVCERAPVLEPDWFAVSTRRS